MSNLYFQVTFFLNWLHFQVDSDEFMTMKWKQQFQPTPVGALSLQEETVVLSKP